MKKLITKGLIHADKKIIYRAGVIKDVKWTKGRNIHIKCEDIQKIDIDDDTNAKTFRPLNDESGFLVPKRRDALCRMCWKELKMDKKFFFKLEQETLSKKYCVSEIFIGEE